MGDTNSVQISLWHASKLRSFLAKITYPVFWVLNRPSLTWFGDLVYDFALRCNGIAINFAGKEGLTRGEEHFLYRHADRLQSGVLLDVGANRGSYARLLRKLAPTARVVAFEPHPTTFARLRDLLADQPEIELINRALGDQIGHLKLYDFRFDDGSSQASLNASAVAFFSNDMVEHEVDCTTLDDFMAEAGIARIDFLKIDTEGLDLSVLRGARKALKERRIGMIQFEFIPANIVTGVSMHGFFQALEGYRISRICLNGELRPLDPYDVKRCEIYVTHNLIATPIDRPA